MLVQLAAPVNPGSAAARWSTRERCWPPRQGAPCCPVNALPRAVLCTPAQAYASAAAARVATRQPRPQAAGAPAEAPHYHSGLPRLARSSSRRSYRDCTCSQKSERQRTLTMRLLGTVCRPDSLRASLHAVRKAPARCAPPAALRRASPRCSPPPSCRPCTFRTAPGTVNGRTRSCPGLRERSGRSRREMEAVLCGSLAGAGTAPRCVQAIRSQQRPHYPASLAPPAAPG